MRKTRLSSGQCLAYARGLHVAATVVRPGRLSTFLAASVFMAACGGSEGSGTSSPDLSVLASGPSQSATQPTPTVVPSEQTGFDNVIAWILDLAPGSPAGPPEFVAYRALMDVGGGGCVRLAEGLQPDGEINLENSTALELYGGVADACLAAFHGRADLWERAAATYSALPVPTSCMDAAAHRLYGELLRKHAENPGGQFVPQTDPSQAQGPPCPTLTALTPDRGPRGTIVRASGINLDRIYELWVFYEDDDGDVFERRSESCDTAQDGDVCYVADGDGLLLTMRDDTNIAVYACVVPQGAVGWNGSGLRFTFEPLPGPSGAPTTTAPAAPTAPCPPPSTE